MVDNSFFIGKPDAFFPLMAMTKTTAQIIWQRYTNSGISALEPPDATTFLKPLGCPTAMPNHI